MSRERPAGGPPGRGGGRQSPQRAGHLKARETHKEVGGSRSGGLYKVGVAQNCWRLPRKLGGPETTSPLRLRTRESGKPRASGRLTQRRPQASGAPKKRRLPEKWGSQKIPAQGGGGPESQGAPKARETARGGAGKGRSPAQGAQRMRSHGRGEAHAAKGEAQPHRLKAPHKAGPQPARVQILTVYSYTHRYV